jgi:hypothetical protein
LAGCGQQDKKEEPAVHLQFSNHRATVIQVPREMLDDVPDDSIEQWLKVHLVTVGAGGPAILGNYVITKDSVGFQPLIPFTPGLEYEVRLKGELLTQVKVPLVSTDAGEPGIVNIYPTIDTVPENLLKLYIEFSKPMQEGRAMEYIRLVRNARDTLTDVFLDLQPELWNKESTILTIWFDPGRIKRDLQPNQRLGAPLQKGMKYKLVVLPGWGDKEGAVIGHLYQRELLTTLRDSLSPDPAKWTIQVPKPGSDQPVEVICYEPLDYLLLKNAIHITDEKGNDIAGSMDGKERKKVLSLFLRLHGKKVIIYLKWKLAWKTWQGIISITRLIMI